MARRGADHLQGLGLLESGVRFNIRIDNGRSRSVADRPELQISLDAVRAPGERALLPGTKGELEARCGSCSKPWTGTPRPARAAMAARGYLYSDSPRARVRGLEIPPIVVILAPITPG